MLLQIFEKYYSYCESQKIKFKINKLFNFKNINKVEENSDFYYNSVMDLLRQKDFPVNFKKFLEINYNKCEVRDYFVVFHLLYINKINCYKQENNYSTYSEYFTYIVLETFKKVCGDARELKKIESFIPENISFENSFHSIGVKEFKNYINENLEFKKSWKNLIIKNEPGLLIKLGVCNQRIDLFIDLQDFKLTKSDKLIIESENKRLKSIWVYYYQHQSMSSIVNNNYASEDENKKSKIKAYIHMEMFLKFYKENILSSELETIKLLQKYIRNIELAYVAEMKNRLYLDNKDNTDSVLNNKDLQIFSNIRYMNDNIIVNKTVNNKLIKF